MRIRAALGNVRRPEYGVVTIPLPIPKEQYDSTIAMLEGLEIGAPLARDCLLYELQGPCPILKRLERAAVNVDELDYLIRRLDSFSDEELAQFQGMAVKMGLNDMTDLIDLTFCCQQATVITDFSDLEAVGRKHFLDLNGGCASMEELAQLDAWRTALELILNGEGAVTPYSVVYDNGMKLERAYDGQHLPCYYYGGDMLAAGLLPREKPQDLSSATWVYLPATEVQISRAVARAGATVLEELSLYYTGSMFPEEVDGALNYQQETLHSLNALAEAVVRLAPEDYRKLGAAVTLAGPRTAAGICRLAEHLEQFRLIPGVRTPEEYGRHIVQTPAGSGLDHDLDGFCDYTGLGLRRMEQEQGVLTDRGYITYQGTQSLEELMMEAPAEQKETMGMGGFS